MKNYLVIGNPIEHSLSPQLHNHWIKIHKINAAYAKKKINEDGLKDLICDVKDKKINGINVTVPFKQQVIPFLDRLSDEAKKEAKEKISKGKLLKEAKDKLKNRGILSGLTREEQEKLAVQEVTLTYALANTFKDQDRLTQRDVDAARNIVNIFSLTRSSADVRASINAIANQLEADIRRQEELFRDAGGLESRITNLRGLAEFETFDKGTVESQLAGDLSLEEIENIIEGIN